MRFMAKLLGVFLFLLLMAGLAVVLVPGEKIAKMASDQFEAQTGRSLKFTGKVMFSVYPVVGLTTQGLELGNADWSKRGPLLKTKGASVGIDAKALLKGKIRIKRIEARAPKVILEKHADGRVNWDFGTGSEAGTNSDDAASAGSTGFTLKRLILRNAALTYVEDGAPATKLKGVTIDLSWPKAKGPATLDLKLKSKGATPLTVETKIDDMKAFLKGKPTSLTSTLNAKGGKVHFDGTASIAPTLSGALSVEVADTAAFTGSLPEMLGVGAIEMPKGFGQALTITSDVTLSKDQKLTLKNAEIKADQNALSGDIDLDFKGRPTLTAKLVADVLDVSSVAGSSDGDSAAASSGWSKAPMDTSALGLIDGQITLKAKGLNTGDFRFGAFSVKTTIENGRAVVDMADFNAFGGRLTGQLIANASKGFSTRADIKASGIDMKTLLSQTAGISRFTGSSDLALKVGASGQSLHGLMNSLDGSMSVKLGQGTITGIDLDALLQGRKGGGTTVFDSMTASGVFRKGVLTNSDLVMKLISIEATGKGQIGVGQRIVDYTFTPLAVTSQSGQTLSVPVRIKGSWDDPKISVDLEQALEQKLDKEIDKAKDKVKEEVRDKVKEEAGGGLLKLLGQD